MIDDWRVEFFDDVYADLALSRTKAQSDAIAKIVVEIAALVEGDVVFDQCCGRGDLSLALARAGMRVFGLDLCAPYVERAQGRARSERAGCAFLVADAAVNAAPSPCRCVVNWFSSFGYGATVVQDQAFLDRAFDSLGPGGVLVLESLNLPRLHSSFQERMERNAVGPEGTTRVVRTSRIVGESLEQSWRIELPDGRVLVRPSRLRLHPPEAIEAMAVRAGLVLNGRFDGAGAPWSPHSERLIVAARRPE